VSAAQTIFSKPNRRIAALALFIFVLDQTTKWFVLRTLRLGDERVVIPGFFHLVHRDNTGAAWSLFTGNNAILAAVAFVALIALYFSRHHFNAHTLAGQFAFGLIFGGIIGNLTDRLLPARHAVVDFLYFFMLRRGGDELGFPAFNVADSAICTGVALIFLINWKNESAPNPVTSGK
jgi:signal peptidase II